VEISKSATFYDAKEMKFQYGRIMKIMGPDFDETKPESICALLDTPTKKVVDQFSYPLIPCNNFTNLSCAVAVHVSGSLADCED
jgi:hypothetical protein